VVLKKKRGNLKQAEQRSAKRSEKSKQENNRLMFSRFSFFKRFRLAPFFPFIAWAVAKNLNYYFTYL